MGNLGNLWTQYAHLGIEKNEYIFTKDVMLLFIDYSSLLLFINRVEILCSISDKVSKQNKNEKMNILCFYDMRLLSIS